MPSNVHPTPFIIDPPSDLLTRYPRIKQNSNALAMKYAFGQMVEEDDLKTIGGQLWGALDMDDALCEGSCEYASYLTLRGSPDKLAQYYLENQAANEDLVYGGGFRSVSGYVERVGVEAWLDYLRTHSQPPWD